MLVVFAQREGQTAYVARACIAITSNSFAAPATVMVELAQSGNPCDAAATPRTVNAGRYTLTASIFSPGSQTAEKSTTVVVDVSGNVTATLDGAALSGAG